MTTQSDIIRLNSYGLSTAEIDKIAVNKALIQKISKDIHYPEHWDTMAYPTVLDAIYEMTGSLFKCSECNV